MMWLYCFIIYIIVGLILSILMLIDDDKHDKSEDFKTYCFLIPCLTIFYLPVIVIIYIYSPLKSKIIRYVCSTKIYYKKRLSGLIKHKEYLDNKYKIFTLGGIVGDRIWNKLGGEYMDYEHRIKPIINKRIDYYKKKIEN